MFHINIKYFKLIILLSALGLAVFSIQASQKVFAENISPEFYESNPWYNTDGRVVFPSSYLGTRLEFMSSKVIKDIGTNKTYSISNSYPANDLSQGISNYSGRFWWYWPENADKPYQGNCLGAILVSVQENYQSTQGVFYHFIPTKNTSDGNCVLFNGKARPQGSMSKSDLDKLGDLGKNLGAVGNDATLMNVENTINPVFIKTSGNEEKIRLLASPLAWKGKDTLTALTNGLLTKVIASDKKVREHLQNSEYPTFADKAYSYYSSSNCGENGAMRAFVVIKNNDTRQAWFVHDNATGGSGDMQFDWWGEDLKCLFFNKDILRHNPMSALGLNSDVQIGENGESSIQVWIGDTANANKELSASEMNSLREQEASAINDNTGAIPNDCDFSGSWNPVKVAQSALNWFGCTVIKGTMGILDMLKDGISSMLSTKILDNSTQRDSIKVVWGKFLIIANSLFVIAFLIMILSTSLNLGFVDAYTVKKFLPRIIIAVILANISFAIIQVVVNITNDLGDNIGKIILSPVPAINANFGSDFGAVLTAALTGSLVAISVSIATGGIFALIPALLMALFAILVGYAVILIRRIIILLLIVVAPFAIALWVIPGLENWAKKWWKLLIEMLMVYPFIVALLSAGQFTAALIIGSKGTSSNDALSFPDAIASFGALIIPYLLLPTVFKMASSTLGNITGMVNNKGKGLFDRGANAARERAKTTPRAAEKARRKSLGIAERERLGGQRIVSRPRTRWQRIQNAATRGKLGQGIGEADIGVLKAQQAEEQVRAQKARQAQYSAEMAAASLELQEHTQGMGRSETLNHLRSVATSSSASNESRRAAIKMLINQKDTAGLEMVQNTALSNNAVRESWMTDFGDNYASLKAVSPHLATEVNSGTSQQELDDARMSMWNNASDEQLAEMHNSGWVRLNSIAPTFARQRFNEVYNDDKLRPKLTRDTVGMFATPPNNDPTPPTTPQMQSPPQGNSGPSEPPPNHPGYGG